MNAIAQSIDSPRAVACRFLGTELSRLEAERRQAESALSRLQEQLDAAKEHWQHLNTQAEGIREYLGLEDVPF